MFTRCFLRNELIVFIHAIYLESRNNITSLCWRDWPQTYFTSNWTDLFYHRQYSNAFFKTKMARSESQSPSKPWMLSFCLAFVILCAPGKFNSFTTLRFGHIGKVGVISLSI